MNILAFAASNSATSINKALVTYAAQEFAKKSGAKIEILDLNDYEMPIYSPQKEAEGFPPQAQQFLDSVRGADRILISFAEHNGSFSAAYKNIFDWASRLAAKVYDGKPIVLLSTSPGARGGMGVLQAAEMAFPHFGADLRGSLSIPNFHTVFNHEKGMLEDGELKIKLDAALQALL